jgi:hypothetical protein
MEEILVRRAIAADMQLLLIYARFWASTAVCLEPSLFCSVPRRKGWQEFTEVSKHVGPILKIEITCIFRNIGNHLQTHNALYPRTVTASSADLPWTNTEAPKSSIQSCKN